MPIKLPRQRSDHTGKLQSTRNVLMLLLSVEDVLKYLMFCKVFKPKMSKDATEYVVNEYKVGQSS